MGPDQGCYEERYPLTVPVARSAAFSVVPLIVALFSHQPLPWVILARSPYPPIWVSIRSCSSALLLISWRYSADPEEGSRRAGA